MVSARIDRFSMVIENDLSSTCGPGSSVSVISATSHARVFHRVLPYFVRQTSSTKLQVHYVCRHPGPGYVEYDAYGNQQKSAEWVDKIEVQVGAKKTDGLLNGRPLSVKNGAPKVSAQIDCTFTVRKRWSHQKQEWVEYPGDKNQTANCILRYDISP